SAYAVDVLEVDFDGRQHVGGGGLGPHHVLGRAPADVREGDRFVVGTSLGRRSRRPRRRLLALLLARRRLLFLLLLLWRRLALAGVDVGEDVGPGDAPALARALDLGGVEVVLGEELADDGRQDLSAAPAVSAPSASSSSSSSAFSAFCSFLAWPSPDGASELTTASLVPTSTVSPSSTRISARYPDSGDGTSESTLSVETSNRGSSSLTSSPTDLNHLVMVPSVTVSPSWGMVMSAISRATPFRSGPARPRRTPPTTWDGAG